MFLVCLFSNFVRTKVEIFINIRKKKINKVMNNER